MDRFDWGDGESWEEEAAEPADSIDFSEAEAPPETPVPRADLGRAARPGSDAPSPAAEPPASITEIYRHERHFVRAKLRRLDIDPEAAEEIHQEVFLEMDRQIAKRVPLRNVRGMLTTITGHLVCNYLRRRARSPRIVHGVETDALPSRVPDAEQHLRSDDSRRLVHAVLARMPPDAAQLIRWIDLGDLTPAEVAAILGREVGTVRVQHHRARQQFRDLAERLDEDEERGAA